MWQSRVEIEYYSVAYFDRAIEIRDGIMFNFSLVPRPLPPRRKVGLVSTVCACA